MLNDELGCNICLRKFPGRKHWQQAKIKMEIFGSGIEASVCPDCQKKIFGKDYGWPYRLLEKNWAQLRKRLRKRAGQC